MERIMEIPDPQYWYSNQQDKSQVLHALRARLTQQGTRNGLSEAHIHRMLKYVDPENPDVLTIGFARRFATYKRATLLFSNLSWLESLVNNEDRPVLFVFAGKAHPADEPGQYMMREIQRISNQPPFVGKILLVEGYDIGMGRLLTSGVDVWLNTPVHPFEASGTSGMKAAINGTINLSVLDGWWAEGYDGTNGWAIPPSTEDQSSEERDRQDSTTLYELLQDEVIPLYYAHDEKLAYSSGWVEMCKRAMITSLPHFNSQRVLNDYARCFYGPAARQGRTFAANSFAVARDLGQWKQRVREAWPGLTLRSVSDSPARIVFSESVTLEVEVGLNGLRPEDVRVECVLHRQMCSELAANEKSYAETHRNRDGVVSSGDETVLVSSFVAAPEHAGVARYRLDLQPPWSGALSYEIRVVPRHANLSHPYELGLMRWL
jgi:starch phosphorylase